jgi:hypothetical protein
MKVKTVIAAMEELLAQSPETDVLINWWDESWIKDEALRQEFEVEPGDVSAIMEKADNYDILDKESIGDAIREYFHEKEERSKVLSED